MEKIARFKGPQSFEDSESDRVIFKGRDSEIRGVMEYVERLSHSVVFGVSGIGKTSLINTGIINSCKQSKIKLYPVVISLKDFASSNFKFAEFVMKRVNDNLEPANTHSADDHLAHKLNGVFSDVEHQDRPHLVLIFDQFESVFESDQFIDGGLRSTAIMNEILELISPSLNVDLDEAEFNYDKKPVILISIVESELAKINFLSERCNPIATNHTRIKGFSKAIAKKIVSELFSTPEAMHGESNNTFEFMLTSKLLDDELLESILEHSASSSNETSPFFLQLYCQWIEVSLLADSETKNLVKIEASLFPKEKFTNRLEDFYSECLNYVEQVKGDRAKIIAATICEDRLIGDSGNTILRDVDEAFEYIYKNEEVKIKKNQAKEIYRLLAEKKLVSAARFHDHNKDLYQLSHAKLGEAVFAISKDPKRQIETRRRQISDLDKEGKIIKKKFLDLKKREESARSRAKWTAIAAVIASVILLSFIPSFLTINKELDLQQDKLYGKGVELKELTDFALDLGKKYNKSVEKFEIFSDTSEKTLSEQITLLEGRVNRTVENISDIALDVVEDLSKTARSYAKPKNLVEAQKLNDLQNNAQLTYALHKSIVQKSKIQPFASSGYIYDKISGQNYRAFERGFTNIQKMDKPVTFQKIYESCGNVMIPEGFELSKNRALNSPAIMTVTLNLVSNSLKIFSPLCELRNKEAGHKKLLARRIPNSLRMLGVSSGKYDQNGEYYAMVANYLGKTNFIWGKHTAASQDIRTRYRPTTIPKISVLKIVGISEDDQAVDVIFGTLDGNVLLQRFSLKEDSERVIKVLAWGNAGKAVNDIALLKNHGKPVRIAIAAGSEIQIRDLESLSILDRYTIEGNPKIFGIKQSGEGDTLILDTKLDSFNAHQKLIVRPSKIKISDLACDSLAKTKGKGKNKVTSVAIAKDLGTIVVAGHQRTGIDVVSLTSSVNPRCRQFKDNGKRISFGAERINFLDNGMNIEIVGSHLGEKVTYGDGLKSFIFGTAKVRLDHDGIDVVKGYLGPHDLNDNFLSKDIDIASDLMNGRLYVGKKAFYSKRSDKFVRGILSKKMKDGKRNIIVAVRDHSQERASCIARLSLDGGGAVTGLSTDQDARGGAVCSDRSQVLFEIDENVNWIDQSHDGRYLASVNNVGDLQVYDLDSEKVVNFTKSSDSLEALWKVKFLFTKYGSTLFTIDRNGLIKVYLLNGEREISTLSLAYKLQVPGFKNSGSTYNFTRDFEVRCLDETCLFVAPVNGGGPNQLFIWEFGFRESKKSGAL